MYISVHCMFNTVYKCKTGREALRKGREGSAESSERMRHADKHGWCRAQSTCCVSLMLLFSENRREAQSICAVPFTVYVRKNRREQQSTTVFWLSFYAVSSIIYIKHNAKTWKAENRTTLNEKEREKLFPVLYLFHISILVQVLLTFAQLLPTFV